MTITQININGLDLISEDYRFSLSGVFDMDKDIATSDLLSDGVSFGRSKLRQRMLTLNGLLRTADPQSVIELNRALAPNGLKRVRVTVGLLGDLTFSAEVVSRAQGSSPRAISLQLMMPDPYLYSLEVQTVQLGATSNAALVLPAVLPWTLGALTGGQATFTNDGNADAYPVITVVGTCDTITVRNLTTGERVDINGSLADSDTLVIDCSAGPLNTRGVYLNGVKRMDLKATSTPGWIHCPPGENVISFSRNSLQVKQHCSVSLRSRWI